MKLIAYLGFKAKLMKSSLSILIVLMLVGFITNCSTIKSSDIVWQSTDGVQIKGTVLLPKTQASSILILIHGSGNIHRGTKWYEIQARKFAEMGLGVLFYDKRGTGDSGGDWKKVNMDQLAEDAITAIPEMKKIEGLEQVRIGLAGYSQGGWIMLKALERSDDVAFLISISGSTQTPGEQGKYVARNRMKSDGLDEYKLMLADSLNEVVNQVYQSNEGWEDAQALLKANEAEGLGKYGVGLIPKESWNWKWYADLPLNYDPRPDLEKLKIPLLAMHGAKDPLVDADLNMKYLEELKKRGADIQNYMDPDGFHILRYRKKHLIFWLRSYWKDDYYEVINRWLKKQDIN